MSRNRKDGRRRGGHRDWLCTEVWSRRCRKVNMWRLHAPGVKRITHRHERRVGKLEIRAALIEEAPDAR
ncbi:MAG: hypothetical protein ACYC3F_16845 [Gemmatimonadaceae bacterium]